MTNAASFALSASLQDVTALGTKRRFTLIGAVGTVVAFEYGLAVNSASVGRVKDPRAPSLVAPTSKSPDLMLEILADGLPQSSPIFDEPSSYLRYNVLQGTVTSCYVDSGAQPSTGPAGAAGPNWISNNGWALVTGTSYVAIPGEYVKTDPTSGAVSVKLPTAVGNTGLRIRVQDATNEAATHNITVTTTSSQTINGNSTATISTNGGGITVVSDGAEWFFG